MLRSNTGHRAGSAFLFRHVLLVPVGFALAAWAADRLGIDRRATSFFFDASTAEFPAHAWPLLELFGHRVAKSAVIVVWLTLLVAAIAASWSPRWSRHRSLLWITLAAMAAGPLIVVALKGINAHHCPWDLKEYGGYADVASAWFVAPAEAGRCFPSGHAAGGFSLVAIYFAACLIGCRRLEAIALVSTLAFGVTFSVVRIVQGAPLLSHNLWSAAVVWSTAALLFAPLVGRRASGPAADSTLQCP